MDISELIIELAGASGPSGYEDAPRELIAEKLNGLVDEIKTDAMGNLIAVKRCGRENAQCIMLDAHMDEIGLVVTGHEKGYLRFSALGGVDPRMLPAAEVRVLTQPPVYGMIDVMPPHALSAEDMDKALPADKLYIDVGMTQDEAEKAVPLGTAVVFAGGVQRLGSGSICGKALDDRSCAAIIISVMEAVKDRQLDYDVVCLFSVQEEVGLRGAAAAAFGINPDYAIVLDVTFGDTPDSPKHKTLKLGGGAAIGLGPNCSRGITNALIETAKSKELKYQLEVMSGSSGTNAWAIQVSRGGVASAIVSLPVKYMHSPIEVVRIRDAQNIVELISSFLINAGEVL